MDCGRCGSELECPNEDGSWFMDDEVECEGCGASNLITLDEDYGEAYVQSYTCAHGVFSEDPCEDCEAEDNLRGE